MEETKSNPYRTINQETNPIRDHILQDDNLLKTIFSSLSPKDLAKVAQVCKRWNGASSSDYVWEHIVREQLPKKYQELPCNLLKDKFVAYQKDNAERINFVSKNADVRVKFKSEELKIFTDKLIEYLKNPNTTKKQKLKAIDEELHGKDSNVIPSKLISDPTIIQRYETLELLLKAGLNPNNRTPQSHHWTPLTEAVLYKESDLIELLMRYGGDPTFKNHGYSTINILDMYDPQNEATRNFLLNYKNISKIT